jgi:queuine tRNA-ribosyltransferase
MFTILKKRSGARLGILRTPHGTIKTPAYVIVATHGRVRELKPANLAKTKTQLVIANTYHLWDAPKNAVRKRLGVRMPTMTDSGGFQVFSLGAAKEHGVGKVLKQPHRRDNAISNVRITEKGVHFSVGNKKRFLSPESSIITQERLGADIIFAFDECTSPLHPHDYTKRSMERTHRWAQRCLDAHAKKNQMLFGIVQGGRFKRLRTASAKKIGSMPFDGFGIGGSFGKDEMRATLAAVVPHLPEEKPRHLLGIGTVTDIFDAVEAGMDTFDCVIPTREARHGRIYTDDGPVNVKKTKYVGNPCAATMHNVRWFNDLLKRIRAALADGSYSKFKRALLTRFLTSASDRSRGHTSK